MAQNTRLMLIDDSSLSLTTIEKSLQNEFDIRTFTDSDEALSAVEAWQPDVVLTDVEMPGRNGYEVCDAIKRNPNTKHIPVLFLSTKDSLRERMNGYEMGGDDYLIKGCDVEELKVKLSLSAERARHSHELKASFSSAQSTALEAMSTSFELGKAVRYIEQSYNAANFEALGQLLCQFASDIDLSMVCMFVARDGFHYYSTSGAEVAPLEAQLLEKLHGGNRFIDFGYRTVVNYPQVGILVKNMPLDNRERYGRVKDTLPFVLGATDAKVRMLDAEKALSAQGHKLTASIGAIQVTLTKVKENYDTNIRTIAEIMTNLRRQWQADIQHLDLTLENENHMLDLIEKTNRQLDQVFNDNNTTETILQSIMKLLQRVEQEQNSIIVHTLSSAQIQDESVMGDIELF